VYAGRVKALAAVEGIGVRVGEVEVLFASLYGEVAYGTEVGEASKDPLLGKDGERFHSDAV
jgi:hypothetical protein